RTVPAHQPLRLGRPADDAARGAWAERRQRRVRRPRVCALPQRSIGETPDKDAGLMHQRRCGEAGAPMNKRLTRLLALLGVLALQQPLPAQEASAQELVVIDLRPKE